jgi:hypothetical protein
MQAVTALHSNTTNKQCSDGCNAVADAMADAMADAIQEVRTEEGKIKNPPTSNPWFERKWQRP